MVSTTSLGSALDKKYQMEIAAANFRTNEQILTSGYHSALHANLEDSVQRTIGKDAMKRKLTARVSPMTRQTGGVYDPRFHSPFSDPQSSQRSTNCKKTEPDVGSTTSSVITRGKQRLAEKRKSSTANVIIPAKSVNSDTLHRMQDEPVSKRPRTILPRTMQGKESKKLN